MKSFITKYKTQIISIITAISALALALTSLGGEVTRVCEIVIAIDAVLIAILKTGFDNKFVDNSVALLKLLQEQYDLNPMAVEEKIAGAAAKPTGKVKIVGRDGTVRYIGGDPEPEITSGTISELEQYKQELEAKKGDKLTDEQLKDLVESYLHPTKEVKEDDASEENKK